MLFKPKSNYHSSYFRIRNLVKGFKEQKTYIR